ncbi:MAG: EpsG family protein [Bacteroidales bacterium]|nr:EpsG family protein [Bacteroidales bacterium]
MNPLSYEPLYLAFIVLVSVWIGVRRIISPDNSYQTRGSGWLIPFLISLAFAIWLGFRPISGMAFGDTANYAMEYPRLGVHDVKMDWNSEWIWQWLMVGCKSAGLSVSMFLLVVELIYVLTAFFAAKRFMPSDPMMGMLFVMGSLMFFSFGVNGIRNGMACHIVLLAISLLLDDKYVWGILLSLVAFGIHRSTALPLVAVFVAILGFRDFRYAMAFWILSILISSVAGDTVSGFFASLGFDDRMTQYVSIRDMSQFSKKGFRWDFLLYSAAPVFMGWYICVYKKLQDNWYNVICMVYSLCNAFWIMVIRSAFSNRFAYLSWFIYPIVIAYPLVNLHVWDKQDRNTGWILLAYVGFTGLMFTFVW